MPDKLKEYLTNELNELKEHKARAIVMVVCVIFLLVILTTEDSSGGEDIDLNAPPKIEQTQTVTENKPAQTVPKPATKDLPVKPLATEKLPRDVKLVLGANAERLTISNPFIGEEKPKPESKTVPTNSTAPPSVTMIQPPIIPKSKEKVMLTGVAIGGIKTAMFLRGNETIFLTIGDEINGRQIADITADFVLFTDNSRVYMQRELE
ncbi:MAG: hypothetical protein K6G55_08310 [Selenomonadaceae bacterium]|nr:hypothetical protein [Selenomonadaceae bacterium]